MDLPYFLVKRKRNDKFKQVNQIFMISLSSKKNVLMDSMIIISLKITQIAWGSLFAFVLGINAYIQDRFELKDS